MRAAPRTWLERCGLHRRAAQDVLVAAGEACADAIEHGHRHDPGGPVVLPAAARVDDLWLTVSDSGEWKTPRPEASAHRGRGPTLMKAMMRQVTVVPGASGTTVRMHTRIA
ncbi:ATP-binding protein [Streptomyces kanasensis]|uniref:ATP-binding protein n=1 Tax=Streptomyces kanasensis TaxID=936756 RepID=UPI0037F6482D